MDMEERKKRLGVRKDPTLRGLEAGMLGKNTVSVLAEDLAKKFRGEEPAAPEVKKLVSARRLPGYCYPHTAY